MLERVVGVKVLEGTKLRLEFEDGVEGEITISELTTLDGVFEPLKDKEHFAKVRVNRDSGTIEWPNGADIDPSILYSEVTGKPIIWEGYGVVYEPNKRL